MKSTLIRWFYTLILILLLPVLGIYLWRQKAASGVAKDAECWQRLGLGIKATKTDGWLFHCASVGEVVAASSLINTLLEQQPDLSIAITTASATGGQRVKQLFGERVTHYYLPIDLPWAMARLIKTLKPQKVIITEVELWPNLLHQCQQRTIPVYMINARMTDKSVQRMNRLAWLFKPMLDSLCHVGAQGQRDYANYLALGMLSSKLTLTRNIKFDLHLSDADQAQTDQLRERFNLSGRTILIAGSTHEPEEQLILNAYQQLKTQIADLLLILVPRHPQRFDNVFQLYQQADIKLVRASLQQQVYAETEVLLADEMGLLKYLYGIADIAFVGGSIAERGGHNPLEAAIWSVPILMGSSQYNNLEICSLLMQQEGMRVVNNAAELVTALRYWLDNPNSRQVCGHNAHQVINENSGAVANNIAMLNSN